MSATQADATTAVVDATNESSRGKVDPISSSSSSLSLSAGDQLGRYRLDDVLGHGGMGVVYAAFDPELDRPVALKVIRPDSVGSTSTGEGQARLLREAQAMAGLSHPNVIPVYDVGRIDGRVYVAMELVEGESLRQWLEEGPRPWPRVVELMLDAGRGLAAAHLRGIVHRDFKPGNVLVGDDGRIRVLDFGLARSGGALPSGDSMSAEVSDGSVESHSSRLPALTEVGAVMGTPAYMAPEQAAGEAVDARSDQFSFCVALYEGLYGHRPFEGKNRRARARAARLGRIRRAPAETRVPDRLRRVVLRGLRPDPEERWPDLAELLRALERAAGRGRRVWVWIAGAVGVIGALVGSRLVAAEDPCLAVEGEMDPVWNATVRAQASAAFEQTGAAYAPDTWSRVAASIDDYAGRWNAARQRTCRARDLGAVLRDLQVACLNRRRAELAALVEVFAEADEDIVRQAVKTTTRLGEIEACEDPAHLGGGLAPPPPEAMARVQELREQLSSVLIYGETHRFERALEVGRAVLRGASELDYPPLRAEALYRHGQTQEDVGDYAEAGKLLEEAYYLAQESGHEQIVAKSATALFFMYGYRQGDSAAAEVWRGHAEAATDRLGDRGAGDRARLAQVSGSVALRGADYTLARDLLAKARDLAAAHYGEDSILVASITGNLGVAQINRGDFEAARDNFERALVLTEKQVGPGHPDVASWLNNLGVLEQNLGNHEPSLVYFRRAYDVESVIFGDRHPNVAMSLNNIGGALAYLDRNEQAKEYFERSIAAYEGVDSVDPIDLARPVGNLGRTLSRLGDDDAGTAAIRRAIRIIEESAGPDHPELSPMLLNLGSSYLDLDQHDEALAQMQRALDIDRKTLGLQHPFVASTLSSMAEVHLDLGRRKAAIPLLEQALEIQVVGEGDPENLAATRFGLARALWPEPGQRARARELLGLAEAGLETTGAAGADRLANLRTWRAKH